MLPMLFLLRILRQGSSGAILPTLILSGLTIFGALINLAMFVNMLYSALFYGHGVSILSSVFMALTVFLLAITAYMIRR